MTLNLYEKHKSEWDTIAVYRPHVAEMATHFIEASSMESALCYGSSVISKWIKRAGGVSLEADRRALEWLKRKKAPADAFPAPVAAMQVPRLLLVACTDETAAKVGRVLALLGCEVTEV